MRRNLTPWGCMVKIELAKRNWLRDDLAKECELSPNYISKLMRDSDPAPEGVQKINAVLGIVTPAESSA